MSNGNDSVGMSDAARGWLVIIGALLGIFLFLVLLPAFLVGGVMMAMLMKAGHQISPKSMLGVLRLEYGTIVALGVLLALGAAVGYGALGAWSSIKSVFMGNQLLLNSFWFTANCALVGGGLYVFSQIKDRKMANNIFDIISDMDAFTAFANGDKAQAIELDPVDLARRMKAIVIGQDEVVDEVANTIARRIRLNRKNKPRAVFMFVGATGAGKTELAKSLALEAFEGRLARYDMNEFTEASSTQRLIGAPPGYIGSEKGGQLTQEIKRLRNGVILFDEIEKAHPDVYKMIMGLLDEGRITEQSTGQTMDASQFVIVLTSNAEHQKLSELSKQITDKQDLTRATKDTLLSVFKPEQLARIDEIFLFRPLDTWAVAQVAGKFLFGFAADCGVELVDCDTALLIDLVRRHEKQSDYGIRELIRLVEKKVIDGMLTAKDEGYKRVAISVEGDEVRVTGVYANAATAAQKSNFSNAH